MGCGHWKRRDLIKSRSPRRGREGVKGREERGTRLKRKENKRKSETPETKYEWETIAPTGETTEEEAS